jgi:hypothetical protein
LKVNAEGIPSGKLKVFSLDKLIILLCAFVRMDYFVESYRVSDPDNSKGIPSGLS